jgi:miniconductance mechanosensitive channel
MDFNFYNLYLRAGLSDPIAKSLDSITSSFIVLVIAFIVTLIFKKTLLVFFNQIAKRTKSNFDDYLIKNKVPATLSFFPGLFVLIWLLPNTLENFSMLKNPVSVVLDVIGALLTIGIIRKLLNSLKDFLKILPAFKDKPIDSYIQVFMIFVWFIGIITILSLLSGKDISAFLTTLGAMSAIILLIFKDTIMGFVASIQVTINDTVRIGDWITMKSCDADGDVIEINLSTVKVQNFDKTITTIPTYKLVSDSFINWRGMIEAGGRRIKRSIQVKVSSIKFIDENSISKYAKIQRISDFISQKSKEIEDDNAKKGIDKSLMVNGRNMTNLGLFRRYALDYLETHPEINQDMTVMVRQLSPTPQGIPIEVYVFIKDKVWLNYEQIVSSIFDHLLASLSYFDLESFELFGDKKV